MPSYSDSFAQIREIMDSMKRSGRLTYVDASQARANGSTIEDIISGIASSKKSEPPRVSLQLPEDKVSPGLAECSKTVLEGCLLTEQKGSESQSPTSGYFQSLEYILRCSSNSATLSAVISRAFYLPESNYPRFLFHGVLFHVFKKWGLLQPSVQGLVLRHLCSWFSTMDRAELDYAYSIREELCLIGEETSLARFELAFRGLRVDYDVFESLFGEAEFLALVNQLPRRPQVQAEYSKFMETLRVLAKDAPEKLLDPVLTMQKMSELASEVLECKGKRAGVEAQAQFATICKDIIPPFKFDEDQARGMVDNTKPIMRTATELHRKSAFQVPADFKNGYQCFQYVFPMLKEQITFTAGWYRWVGLVSLSSLLHFIRTKYPDHFKQLVVKYQVFDFVLLIIRLGVIEESFSGTISVILLELALHKDTAGLFNRYPVVAEFSEVLQSFWGWLKSRYRNLTKYIIVIVNFKWRRSYMFLN